MLPWRRPPGSSADNPRGTHAGHPDKSQSPSQCLPDEAPPALTPPGSPESHGPDRRTDPAPGPSTPRPPQSLSECEPRSSFPLIAHTRPRPPLTANYAPRRATPPGHPSKSRSSQAVMWLTFPASSPTGPSRPGPTSPANQAPSTP